MEKNFGIALGGETPIQTILRCAELAENEDFESIWITENGMVRDALVVLSALALHTERIRLGTSIINVYSRNPVQNAAAIATIDEFSRGRTILGLGAGVKSFVEPLGIEFNKPLLRVKESVEIIRELLAGKTATYEGKAYQLRNASLRFEPFRKYIPIYLGSMFPKSLQLAGEIADGVILGGFASTDYVKYATNHIKMGVEKAGRDFDEIDVVCLLETCVSENSEVVREHVMDFLLRFLVWEPFDVVLKQSGDWLMEKTALVRKVWNQSKDAARNWVTDDIIDCLTVSGSPTKCSRRIKEYINAGVKTPVIRVSGPDDLAAIQPLRSL